MPSPYIIKYDEKSFQDILEIINWYDQFSKALGTKFLNQVWLAESKVQANPLAFLKVSKTNFRRILVSYFPFKIFYRVEADTIIIIAIIHTSRSNRFVKRRLT